MAAYRAQDFFCSPSNSRYNELREAVEKAESWPAVRAAALHFLETGERPGASTGSDGHKTHWPLPEPELTPTSTTRYGHQRFPALETLIRIAISDERFDDAVGLYSRLRKAKRWGWDTDPYAVECILAGQRERHHVTLVAVTQHLNSGDAAGRMTIHALMSFAQFDREATGERIRDKTRTTRRQGLWSGNITPLGYAARGQRLEFIEEEAKQARHIECGVGDLFEFVPDAQDE